jgi:hypothetical protein
MLLLMATQVVMTFITGADAFQEGWRKGAEGEQIVTTWSAFIGCIVALAAVIAALVSFFSFARFILNVNHNKVFVWENVPLLRLTAYGLIIAVIVFVADELYTGSTIIDVYDNYFDLFIFGVFNLIVSEVFAVGLKLKEEQELTI